MILSNSFLCCSPYAMHTPCQMQQFALHIFESLMYSIGCDLPMATAHLRAGSRIRVRSIEKLCGATCAIANSPMKSAKTAEGALRGFCMRLPLSPVRRGGSLTYLVGSDVSNTMV